MEFRQGEIKHNFYQQGAVQSLGFVDRRGREMTVGVLLPGNYDFGEAQRAEEIFVTSGELIAREMSFISGGRFSLKFKKGEKIEFQCADTVSYICFYD